MKVHELIKSLQNQPQDVDVLVWLPGSYIRPGSVFEAGGNVHIEGDLLPGSALDTITPEVTTRIRRK